MRSNLGSFDSTDSANDLLVAESDALVLFSDFTNIDFTNVQSVVVTFGSLNQADADYTGQFFGTTATAIPTPAALPAGIAMIGAMVAARRRRKAA